MESDGVMKKFEGILICTDLDGTLLRNDKKISTENTEAIEYFKSEGGYFTFITGRMHFYAEDSYLAVRPNAPVGCINGGGLYDFADGEYVWKRGLSVSLSKILHDVETEFPDMGIIVNTFCNAYFCKENSSTVRFRETTRLPDLKRHYDDIDEEFAKVIFANDSTEQVSQLAEFLSSRYPDEDVSFIRSSKSLYEILPKGIGKGTAVKKLSDYLGIDMNKTVAIGDYNNDISMFEAAKVGVAVSNACADALNAADYVTVSNEEHAIARIISDISNGRLAL